MLTTLHTTVAPYATAVLAQAPDFSTDEETQGALEALTGSDLWAVFAFVLALIGFGFAVWLFLSGFFAIASTKDYKKGWLKVVGGVLVGGFALNFGLFGDLLGFGGSIWEVGINSLSTFFEQF